MSTLSN